MDNTGAIIVIGSMLSGGGGLVWNPNACDGVSFFECAMRPWPVFLILLVYYLFIRITSRKNASKEDKNQMKN
jgi:hypothetical protein